MAIAFDNATAQASASFSYTATGSNLLMVAMCRSNGGTPSNFAATYNGVSLTNFAQGNWTGNTALFYLFGPSTGSNTFTFTPGAGSTFRVAVATYTGCRQSTFPDVTGNFDHEASNTSATSTLTPGSNSWIVFFGDTNGTYSSTNYTQRADNADSVMLFDTNGIVSGSTAVTVNVTATSVVNCIGYAFAPVAVAASGSNPIPSRNLLGVGI